MASVAEVLERAADLLEEPDAWTQGVYARDHNNRQTDDRDKAECFCALGAINYAAGRHDLSWDAREQQRVFEEISGIDDVPTWNDDPERTQSEVVAKLREAAALAREQGK
jgi:hypothetical protein